MKSRRSMVTHDRSISCTLDTNRGTQDLLSWYWYKSIRLYWHDNLQVFGTKGFPGMFQKLPDLIAGEIDDHGTDLGAIPDSDVLEGNSSRDGVHTMRWAIIVNEISFQIAFFLLELRSLCSKGPSTTAKDKKDDESQTISTGRLYTMCYLLHFKKGYNCQHEVLEQREKVDCGQKNCALSDLAHKLDESHTLKECRETCIKRMGATQDVVMERIPRECNECRISGF